jgi:TonB-dependent receptor
LFAVPTNNISRIEVTKVPTPDMSAGGLGGSINIISKSGFERKRPLLTYNIYSSFPYRQDDALTLKERVGPTAKLSTRTILPSFDLNYLRPVNDSLVVTLTASKNLNYNEARTTSPTWDLVNLVQTASSLQISPAIVEVRSGRIGVDWRVSEASVLSASIQYRKREGTSAQHNFNTAIGAGATGGPTFAQGAATGVGSLTMSVGPSLELHNGLMLSTLKFTNKGNVWKADANAGYSVSKHRRPSTEKGYFSTVTSTISNLVIRADGISGSGKNKESIQPASYRIVDRTGAVVNPFNGNDYSLATTLENAPAAQDEKMEAKLDLARSFGSSLPFTLKTGVAVARQEVSSSDTSKTYTFRSGASTDVRKVGNYGLVNDAYSAVAPAYMTGDKFQWISPVKIYDLFKTRPDYFLLNEAAAHSTRVNGAKRFRETISATYLRGDMKFLENRLWLVAGVRYERTANDGQGPLDDISAQYVKDAAGKVVRNAAGQPTLISTDALVRNQLRYKEFGSRGGGDYGDFYPSVNGTYTIIDGLVARAGYARTIGRPNVSLIIPGVAISEPTATNPTITVVDSGLKPWTADNYDLTLESYLLKGGFGSVGVFKKNIQGFFVSTASAATPDVLETYGIPTSGDYLNYTVQRNANGGDASITGLEFAYKQSLVFLPQWARGVQVFANYTKLSLGGSSQSDFTGFNPKTLSWGASFIRGRFAAKFTSSEQGETRRAPVAASATIPAGTYLWQGAKTRYTISFEYAFTRRIGVHVALNNFNGLGFTDIQRRYAPGTPEYARFQRFQEWGKNAVVGIKGEF